MEKSFMAWMGGKSQLAKTIIPKIPEHHCYAEVFAGAGWVLFKKSEDISRVEILNDVNSDLVTLYRVVKFHLEEFLKTLKWLLVARDEFHRFMSEAPESLTDIQRAARFYYILRNGYGARLKRPSFSIGTARPSNFNLLRIEEDLSAAHLRLSRVYIENMDYKKFIPRFDRPDTKASLLSQLPDYANVFDNVDHVVDDGKVIAFAVMTSSWSPFAEVHVFTNIQALQKAKGLGQKHCARGATEIKVLSVSPTFVEVEQASYIDQDVSFNDDEHYTIAVKKLPFGDKPINLG